MKFRQVLFPSSPKAHALRLIAPTFSKESARFWEEIKTQIRELFGYPVRRFALDIGSHSVKIISYVKRLGRLELTACEQISYGERFDYTEADSRRSAFLKQILEDFFVPEMRREPLRLSLTLPSSLTFIQRTNLPVISSRLLHRAVEFEVKDKIPMPVAELVWGYLPLPETSRVSRGVVLAAVRKQVVKDLFHMAGEMNLTIDRVDVGPAVIYQYLRAKMAPGQTLLVLDLGAHTTDVIAITKTGFWSRTVTFGGFKLVQAASQNLGMAAHEVEKIMQEQGLENARLKTALESKIEDLARELKRTLTLYQQELGAQAFDGLLLLGGLARLRGLDAFFSSALQLPGYEMPPEIISELKSPRVFFQAACLAHTEGPPSLNLIPQEERKIRSRSSLKMNFFLYTALLGLVLFLQILGSVFETRKTKALDQALEQKIMRYEEDKKQVRMLEERIKPWAVFFEDAVMRGHQKDLILRILDELEAAFPRSVWVDKISFEVATKELVIEGRMQEKLAGVERLKEALERSRLLDKVSVTSGTVESERTRRFSCRMEVAA